MATRSPETIRPAARQVLNSIGEQFYVQDSHLQEITKRLVEDFNLGLKNYGRPIAMLPTFVSRLPDGTEKGTFLTLDFAEDNVHVCEVKLHGRNNVTERGQWFDIPRPLMTGEANALFDFLADCVETFLEVLGPQNEISQLGVTFGFPVTKTALNEGKILSWSKEFDVKNTIGMDVLQLLQAAFDRKGMHVKCAALINDTTATLLAKAYASEDRCFLGAIFGWGTNGAYVEDMIKIAKIPSSSSFGPGSEMIVNTEWGAFDNERTVLPSTPFDIHLDRASANPGVHVFEKMISEMYLGDIAQRVIDSLVRHSPPLLFNGVSTPTLDASHGVSTRKMAMIESTNSLAEMKQSLVDHLGVINLDAVSDEDAATVKWICEQISTRAAKLCGCAVAAALIQTGHAQLGGDNSKDENKLLVAAQGSLIQLYPHFEARLRQSLASIVGNHVEKRLEIGIVHGGSAIGAALAAWESVNM